MNPLSAILFVKQYRTFFTRTSIAKLLCPGRFAKDTAVTQGGSSSVVHRARSIFSKFRDTRIGSSSEVNSEFYAVTSQQNPNRDISPSMPS